MTTLEVSASPQASDSQYVETVGWENAIGAQCFGAQQMQSSKESSLKLIQFGEAQRLLRKTQFIFMEHTGSMHDFPNLNLSRSPLSLTIETSAKLQNTPF